MAVTNKDFKVKNGLVVNGTATFGTEIVVNATPITFNSQTKRLEINVNNQWVPLANLDDAATLSFEDIGITVDYDGTATYIIQGNGVTPSATSKFVDGGSPTTDQVRYIFDGGVIQ